MCGRYANFLPAEAMREAYKAVGEVETWQPSWNVAPRQDAPVVRRHPETGERRLSLLRWGLIPHWSTEPGRQPINAREETVETSPMFRSAFKSRRCLVPVTAYYEWTHAQGGKIPFAFAAADGAPLSFAGLWEGWEGPDGRVRTFIIITTGANALMEPIHDRMPVTFREPDWERWLTATPDEAHGMLGPTADGLLKRWEIGRAIGNVAHNGPSLLDPV
jgi:putative SOS response-associated peptidase YedK